MTPFYKGNQVADAFFEKLLKIKNAEGGYKRDTGDFYFQKVIGDNTIRLENLPESFSLRVEIKHKEFVDYITLGWVHIGLYFRVHTKVDDYFNIIINGLVYSSRVPNDQRDSVAKELISLFNLGKNLKIKFRPTGIRAILYLRLYLGSLFITHPYNKKHYWIDRGFYYKSKSEYYFRNESWDA